ncbi:MAG TPA: acyl-CoA dehydrogenase family protein [Acidimicrobiia bacterium]|nr:acyl-CoA dehydrogenase family protein [Acidimicrobiia bacterium]HMC81176.1 acyl-CoA dehydrogenase family protein [Acidimicrobiia bacterium]
MDFTLTDDQGAVTEAAAQVAGAADPWGALADGGWLDILLEDDRGLGYLGLVAEALGAAGVAVPLVGTAVVWPTLFGGSAGGRRVGVADAVDGDGAASGSSGLLCEDGVGAEVVVVLGDGVAEIHETFAAEGIAGLEGDGLARVRTEGPAADRCKDPELVAEARRRAAAVTAAEMAGAIDRIATMTAAYVTERQQFGRPISAFQVVAHGAARLATLAEAATWAARLACTSADPSDTAAAKGWISAASAEAVALGHQLHGAIGFTEEYGLQRLSKRLRTLRFAFGDDRFHHRTLGRRSA